MRGHKRLDQGGRRASAARCPGSDARALFVCGRRFGQLREAAAAGDAGTLASYVDFPALRASTKAQLRPRFGGLGAALARSGVSEFRLHRQCTIGGKGDIVFRRHGLGWKLSEVRIARQPG